MTSSGPGGGARRSLRCLCALFAVLTLSACTTLYTKTRDWHLPGGLSNIDVTASLSIGLFSREASIAVNGQEILSGRSYFWSRTITMSGSFQGFSIEATCDTDEKVCDLAIAGIRLPALKIG